jgi:hypothetical protein
MGAVSSMPIMPSAPQRVFAGVAVAAERLRPRGGSSCLALKIMLMESLWWGPAHLTQGNALIIPSVAGRAREVALDPQSHQEIQ